MAIFCVDGQLPKVKQPLNYLRILQDWMVALATSQTVLLTVSGPQPLLAAMKNSQDTQNFEGSLKDLEKIVAELEKGEQPLEDQLKSFEKGVALSRDCMKRLDEVEKRVEMLVQSSDGKISATVFDVGSES